MFVLKIHQLVVVTLLKDNIVTMIFAPTISIVFLIIVQKINAKTIHLYVVIIHMDSTVMDLIV